MTKILSPDAYSQKNIPELAAYGTTIKELKSAIHSSSEIAGGVFIGSTALGKFDLSSDIDLVVVFHTSRENNLLDQARNRLIEVKLKAKQQYINLDIAMYYANEPDLHENFLDWSFKKTIEYFEIFGGGCVKDPISHHLWPRDEDYRTCTLRFLGRKCIKLEKVRLGFDDLPVPYQVDILTDVLHGTCNAARHIILARTGDLKKSHGTSKSDLGDIYKEHANSKLHGYLLDVIDTIKEYNSLLKPENHNVANYEKLYTRIQDSLPATIHFLRQNMNLFY